MKRYFGIMLLTTFILTGCGRLNGQSETNKPIPTLIDPTTLPTSIFLTQNAPPFPGFGDVTFDPIEAQLANHPGWVATMSGSFQGTFDDTGDLADGRFDATIQANELSGERRVVLNLEGAALSSSDNPLSIEGVRISNDYYIVDTNGSCTKGGEETSAIADLSAGQVLGGVTHAVPTGHRQEIDGLEVWQYTFSPERVRLPAIRRDASSTVDIGADLWIAPAVNAVLRFELNLELEHVQILWGSRPVSGTLYMRYDLSVPDLDVEPNVSVPHGC